MVLGRTKYDFNPRPREEGDEPLHNDSESDMHFNPRPREEGDYLMTISIIQQFHFNPRPREEGDIAKRFEEGDYTKFQSTPS